MTDKRSTGINLKGELFGGQPSIQKKRPESKKVDVVEETEDDSIRINIRVSSANLAFLKQEVKTSATNVSALCSLAVSDWCDERRAYRQKLKQYEDMITLMESDPKTFKEFVDYIKNK